MQEFNKSVEQNLQLNEKNKKLTTKKKELKEKLDYTSRKLQEVISLVPFMSEKKEKEPVSPMKSSSPFR